MRIWLTGGSGFVGSNLIAEFRRAGDDVRAAVHRTPPGMATSMWRGDLLDAAAVRADIVRYAPDVVVHAAIRNDLTGLRADWRGAWAEFVDAARHVVQALEAGRPFTLWECDQINTVATPSLASESARMIRRIGELGEPGVFHCCGADAMSRRDFAERVCEVFGLDGGLLRFGQPGPEAMGDEPIPYDTSLDAAATSRRLGMPLLGILDLLTRFCEEYAGRP